MVLTDDQRALQETARRFARERLLPDYQKREKVGTLDRALVAEMGALGLHPHLPRRHCRPCLSGNFRRGSEG